MLSAEHYALEHRAVQALLDIRQKEVAYMTERFNSVGTQSALIAGLAITTLTALDPGIPANSQEPDVTLEGVRQIFWASSAACVVCSLHCILNSTFVAVWGPGLALRGPTGSVSKAFNHMVRERVHVMFSFVGSIVFLLIQSVLAFFILDKRKGLTPSSAIATIILVGGGLVSALCLIRMSKRFFISNSISMNQSIEDEGPAEDTANTRGSSRSQNLLNLISHPGKDPDELVQDVLGSNKAKISASMDGDDSYLDMNDDGLRTQLLPRAVNRPQSSIDDGGSSKMESEIHTPVKKSERTARRPYFSCQGYLEKRGRLTGAWRKRYFRLYGTKLYEWDTLEEYEEFMKSPRDERRKAKPKMLSLRGFQVLVKSITGRHQRNGSSASKFCFVLDALDDGTNRRNRTYRAQSEGQLREWVESLVAASLIAQ